MKIQQFNIIKHALFVPCQYLAVLLVLIQLIVTNVIVINI